MLLLVGLAGPGRVGTGDGIGSVSVLGPGSGPSWIQVAPNHGPTLGAGPMAFDAADGYVLLYEVTLPPPRSSCGDQETWSFSQGSWTELPSSSAPKFDTALMAYDSNDGYIVLFGGCGTDSNQTWTFHGGQWTNITSNIAPPAREASNLVYDPVLKAVVLFGGYVYANTSSGAGYRANDTWELQGGTWRNVTTALAPPPRDLYGMSFDSADGSIVLFGGVGAGFQNATAGSCCNVLGDTWTYTSTVWRNESVASSPSPRSLPALSNYPAGNGTMLFGGQAAASAYSSNGPLLGDTWLFSNGTWQNLTLRGHPPARTGADLVYDPIAGAMVLFGGSGSTALLNDTWTLNASLGPGSPGNPGPNGTAGANGNFDVEAAGGVAGAAGVVGVVAVLVQRAHLRREGEELIDDMRKSVWDGSSGKARPP
jgi:hypothetical protein